VSKPFDGLVQRRGGGIDPAIPELGPADSGTRSIPGAAEFFVTVFAPGCSWSITVTQPG
jgi:hypothetical protein